MKKYCVFFPALIMVMSVATILCVNAQRKPAKVKLGKICGNPRVECRTGGVVFQEHEIPSEVPKGKIIISDSEQFYAVILKTVKLNLEVNCENAISEEERLKIRNYLQTTKFSL